jgi:bacteriophage exclusion system BrxC/D-like protein
VSGTVSIALTPTRVLAVCLAIALPAVGATACGSSRAPTDTGSARVGTSAPGLAVDTSVKDTDGDNDTPRSRDDPDNDIVMTFGHAADARDMQAVASLLNVYYKAAASGDGRKACSLLYWLYAETTVEEHNRGKASGSRETCAQLAAKLFHQHHGELAEDVKAIDVAVLRVKGKRGSALVRFGTTRERLVSVQLDHGAWRMNTLLDNGAP